MGSFRWTLISIVALWGAPAMAWAPTTISNSKPQTLSARTQCKHSLMPLHSSPDAWNGEVVSNTANGQINGCSIEPVGNGELVLEWKITIDGIEADLGRFSEAIYKKITSDAKKERFQGFRPGTIPPHLLKTYIAFAMDECARETVLEAMQQNNIRPFDNARTEFVLENFVIPPPPAKKGKKKKKSKKKKGANDEEQPVAAEIVEEPKWRTFESMKEAVDAGWKPGQSFSFVAKNVKGQKVKSNDAVQGSKPLGLNY